MGGVQGGRPVPSMSRGCDCPYHGPLKRDSRRGVVRRLPQSHPPVGGGLSDPLEMRRLFAWTYLVRLQT